MIQDQKGQVSSAQRSTPFSEYSLKNSRDTISYANKTWSGTSIQSYEASHLLTMLPVFRSEYGALGKVREICEAVSANNLCDDALKYEGPRSRFLKESTSTRPYVKMIKDICIFLEKENACPDLLTDLVTFYPTYCLDAVTAGFFINAPKCQVDQLSWADFRYTSACCCCPEP
ncbi:unnamed protein product [Cyprideis torosa]|uniref:Uncharacterized protein n=1 Tax=Cyprideis torosa TaxID=163714 RepID=A0A7R8W6I1_9CRUS|nr:unnamed protein product [Cyprideis torosa]CAG0885252.1 unnamed protein product [Cyprideis torosa]